MPFGSAPVTRLIGRMGRGMLRFAERRGASMSPGGSQGFNFSSPVLSGVTVTPQSALTLMAFWAGVNVLSTDVAKLPYMLYRNVRGGGMKPATRDPRYRLVKVRPNAAMNGMRYWQMVMGHALGWGAHYSRIIRDGEGMPNAFWPLHPGTTKPKQDEKTGELYYWDTYHKKKYKSEDILHIAGLSFNGINAYNPTTVGSQAIGLGIATEQMGASLFGNGAIPRGILKTKGELSEDAARRLRDTFFSVHGGPANANKTAVLEEDYEWEETQISPEAAQFLATRAFQVLEIARLLNMPPHKLQDYSQSHLANVEEANLDYLTNTLTGWLETIEAECNMKLLFEDEMDRLFFQHDMSALLRGNSQARSEQWSKYKTMGVVNSDTIAAREGFPIPGPENGGHLYLIQSQNIPQQHAGQPQPKPAPAPKPPLEKGEPDSEPDPQDPPVGESETES